MKVGDLVRYTELVNPARDRHRKAGVGVVVAESYNLYSVGQGTPKRVGYLSILSGGKLMKVSVKGDPPIPEGFHVEVINESR